MRVTGAMLARAATLSDYKLVRLFDQWQRDFGIDPAYFGIEPGNARSIRHALVQADEDDLRRLNDLLARRT